MNTEERMDRALEGLLPEQAWRELQAEVIADPEVRRRYVEKAWLHGQLRSLGGSLWEQPRVAPPPQRRFWLGSVAVGLGLAACLALVGLVFSSLLRPEAAVATLIHADNCRWAASDLPTTPQSRLGAGKMALVEGIATLKFDHGAVVTLEAPTTLEIRDLMHCQLLEGSVVAEVPEAAHGFSIDTSDLKVVDLGTRFGITASAVGNSQVHVFEGEVEISRLPDGQRQRLTEGKGLNVTSGSTQVGQEPSRPSLMAEEDGWKAISTSFGRGKDAFARRGHDEDVLGGQPLIMVKHSDLAESRNNERRAFISFDVSQIQTRKLQEAQLVLDPEPSGFGFSALVPDSRFAVYAVTDESLDSWEESDIRWSSAPACEDAGLLPQKTRRLGEFWISRGSSSTITLREKSLAEFIRTDTNGLITLILVRETGETAPSGLVHAFAAKEHPSARPPTLRIK